MRRVRLCLLLVTAAATSAAAGPAAQPTGSQVPAAECAADSDTSTGSSADAAVAAVQLRVQGPASAAHISYPTGDKAFSVLEAFPAQGRLSAEGVSPFLLAHEWGKPSKTLDGRVAADPGPPSQRDRAKTVGWHPHRGFDLITYVKEGRGSHADSLGNVAVVRPGGVQWMRSGSGIEHAEGGGNPPDVNKHGFQLWINLHSSMKMAAPAYGTVQPEDVPEQRSAGGGLSRYVAGHASKALADRADFQIIDCELPPRTTHAVSLPRRMGVLGTTLVYAYHGHGKVGGASIGPGQTVVLGPAAGQGGTAAAAGISGGTPGVIHMEALGAAGFGCMVFCGTPLEDSTGRAEQIAWRGPIVMNTQAEIQTAYAELRQGSFYKARAAGDYRLAADQSNVPYATARVDVHVPAAISA